MLDALVGCQPRWIGQPVSTLSIALPHPKFREIGRLIGMATKYGLDGSGLNSGRAKRYCPIQNHPDQICGPLKPFIQWVLGLFTGVKRPEPEVYH